MQEDLLGYKDQGVGTLVNEIRDKNREKALSVVAPIDDALASLGAMGKLPTAVGGSLDSLIASATNKRKMVDYSDVKFEDVYDKYSDGTFAPKYKNYSTTNLDQEDVHAKMQSTSDKWINGLKAFIPNVATNIAGQLIGTVYGAIASASTGTLTAMYDNKVFDAIDDMNTYTRNKLPVYKSKEDREATGFNYLTKASTWADDMLNGASFMVGAVASELIIEAATEGAASSTAVARWAPRLGKFFGEGAAAVDKMNEARKVANIGEKVFGASKAAEAGLAIDRTIAFGKAAQFGRQARFALTSAPYESAFEAHTFKKDAEKNFYSNFQAMNGRMPTLEEEMNFRNNINSAADGVFGFNMAILIPSNFAMMGHWFDIKNPIEAPGKWLDSKLFGIGYKKVGEEFVETSANKVQKFIGKAYGLSKPMISEGIWEEGMQSVAQNTGKNWVESRYDPKYTKNTLDLVNSFTKALGQTYGTGEGWKEIEAGMVIGLLGGTVGNKIATGKWNPDYANEAAKNKLIVDTRNTYSAQRTAEAIAMSNRMQQSTENLHKAQASGDMLGQERARKEAALTQLNFANNLGYMEDAVNSTVESIKNIENSRIMKEYGVDEEGAKGLKEKMINEYKETAKTYKKNSDFAHYYIAETLTKGEKELLKNHGAENLREAIAYELTMGAETDKFSSNVLEAIKQKVGSTFASQDLLDALTIDDVLMKAGKETKRAAEKKVSEITKLKAEVRSLEEEYKKVETTFYNSTSEDGKKELLNKLDAITNKKQAAEKQRENLAKEYEVLFTTAKMKNPFNKDTSEIAITATKLDVLKDQAESIKGIISSYKEIDPQDALHLEKLIEEYGKSISAYTKHADIARMLTTKDLNLTGKKSFLRSFGNDVSPSQTTIDLVEALSTRMAQTTEQVAQATVEGNKGVKEVVKEGEEKKKGATIEKPTPEQKDAKKQEEIQKVNEDYNNKITGLQADQSKPSVAKNGHNNIEGITFSSPGVSMEGFTIDGNYYNILSHSGRAKTLVNINGVIVPFYLTSGQGGKALEPGWYPFFGVGKDGWLNKTDRKDMESYYSRYWGPEVAAKVKGISSELNAKYGVDPLTYEKPDADPTTTDKPITSMMEKTEDYINNNLSVTPTVNDQDARINLRANVEQLGKEIEAGTPKNRTSVEKDKQAKLDAIEKKYAPKEEVATVETKKSIRETIADMLKNNAYLLEYYGEDSIPQAPTHDEIEEFYELAARAIDDPKIDTDLIAFKNPYNYKRFSPTTRPSLSKAEVTRLQELNNKMADWQLLEGVSNQEGISVNDMILQDIAVNQFVEPIINNEVLQDELLKTAEKTPKVTDSGEDIRNEEVLQVYQDVVLKRNKKGTTISHMSLPGLLAKMDISDTVAYVETKVVKSKEEAVPGTAKDINISEVSANVKPGANFVVTFSDGETATIVIEKSGSLLIKTDKDFQKILKEADINYVENALTKDSGFSPVYDNKTGVVLPTDFKDSSAYSPMELYNMIPGDTVTFSLDLTDDYNQKIIQDYIDGMEEFTGAGGIIELEGVRHERVVQLDKDLSDQLKINVLDIKGRKLGDLKANYDTNNTPEFLLLREEALEIIKKKGEVTIADVDVQLSKESFIKHIFLGMPNFVFEEGAIKYFDINPKSVIDYGYVQEGKVVLKNNTKRVRQDYVKGLLNKEGLPVVVFQQGKYLVAFPMQLKAAEAKLGDSALDSLLSAKNLGAGVLEFNNTLANNGLSPATYNLHYINAETQTLFSEDMKLSDSLNTAIEDLNKKKQTVDVSTWILPEHSKENLVNEASVAIDIDNNPLSSPKPIINLEKMIDFTRDWYSDAVATGNISIEKATEIANKMISGEPLTTKEYDFSDHPAVQFQIDSYIKLNPDQQSDADDAKNEPC